MGKPPLQGVGVDLSGLAGSVNGSVQLLLPLFVIAAGLILGYVSADYGLGFLLSALRMKIETGYWTVDQFDRADSHGYAMWAEHKNRQYRRRHGLPF